MTQLWSSLDDAIGTRNFSWSIALQCRGQSHVTSLVTTTPIQAVNCLS